MIDLRPSSEIRIADSRFGATLFFVFCEIFLTMNGFAQGREEI